MIFPWFTGGVRRVTGGCQARALAPSVHGTPKRFVSFGAPVSLAPDPACFCFLLPLSPQVSGIERGRVPFARLLLGAPVRFRDRRVFAFEFRTIRGASLRADVHGAGFDRAAKCSGGSLNLGYDLSDNISTRLGDLLVLLDDP